jgi:hypothetical protein
MLFYRRLSQKPAYFLPIHFAQPFTKAQMRRMAALVII